MTERGENGTNRRLYRNFHNATGATGASVACLSNGKLESRFGLGPLKWELVLALLKPVTRNRCGGSLKSHIDVVVLHDVLFHKPGRIFNGLTASLCRVRVRVVVKQSLVAYVGLIDWSTKKKLSITLQRGLLKDHLRSLIRGVFGTTICRQLP